VSKPRSAETELRHARSANTGLRQQIQAMQAELNARRQCGQIMSNICFNLSQNEAYDAQHRQSMRDCREMWDQIRKVQP
jgi:hypothetical protein